MNPNLIHAPAKTAMPPHGMRVVAWFVLLFLSTFPSLAASPEPGRLFYTPAQRAQLEAARSHAATLFSGTGTATPNNPPAVRYNGIIIRSDGTRTNWVNGQPQSGTSGVTGLKPGQIRADGNVYEPYQVLHPAPEPAIAKEPSP